jgi:hypothetical protein
MCNVALVFAYWGKARYRGKASEFFGDKFKKKCENDPR